MPLPLIRYSDSRLTILTKSGKLVSDISRLPWPEYMPLLSFDQDITGEDTSHPYPNDLLGWIEYAIPTTLVTSPPFVTINQMRQVLISLTYTVMQYRYNKQYRKLVRAFSISQDWNYLVRTEYNVAISLLGYTENQLPYINDAAKYLISISLPDSIIEVIQDNGRFVQIKPLSSKR